MLLYNMMYCNMVIYNMMYCNMVLYNMMYCNMVIYNMMYYNMMYCNMVLYNMMYCNMVIYNMMYYNMMYCNMVLYNMMYCNMVIYNMIYCNILQCFFSSGTSKAVHLQVKLISSCRWYMIVHTTLYTFTMFDVHVLYRYKYHLFPPLIFLSLSDWAASNYPRPRTNTGEWLHKVIDRSVSSDLLSVKPNFSESKELVENMFGF